MLNNAKAALRETKNDIKIAIKMIKEQPEEYQRWFTPFYPTMHYVGPTKKISKWYDTSFIFPRPWAKWAKFFNKTEISYIIRKSQNM